MAIIRRELPDDIPAVRVVNESAFGQPQEADLVDKLRVACPDALSLVAVDEGEVVGHVLFTPVTIEAGDHVVAGMGLAPMAVFPERQRRGIGSELIETGLAERRQSGCPFVIVLGHAEYYPRFGFVPASPRGIRCQWDGVPDDAFMVLVLDEVAMNRVAGVARYRSEFDDAV